MTDRTERFDFAAVLTLSGKTVTAGNLTLQKMNRASMTLRGKQLQILLDQTMQIGKAHLLLQGRASTPGIQGLTPTVAQGETLVPTRVETA